MKSLKGIFQNPRVGGSGFEWENPNSNLHSHVLKTLILNEKKLYGFSPCNGDFVFVQKNPYRGLESLSLS